MVVLGIESSCDETAAAVLAEGRRVLSSVVASQDAVHAPYGGVVPELASRRHLEVIVTVIEKVFFSGGGRHTDWNCDWSSDVCASDLSTSPRSVTASMP